MKNIILITGDNVDLINDEVKKNVNDADFYIKFPENNKHPKVWSAELREYIKSCDSGTNIIISSFSEILLNLLGYMIYKKELNCNNVKIIINSKKFNTVCTYDEEGYLVNYPFDYLGWILDEEE